MKESTAMQIAVISGVGLIAVGLYGPGGFIMVVLTAYSSFQIGRKMYQRQHYIRPESSDRFPQLDLGSKSRDEFQFGEERA